jgi:3-phosphoglycerate kinase
MKTIKDIDVCNKRVLVRVDFNVPQNKNGSVADDFRIRASLPTIRYLLDKKAKVILISHLGKPENGGNKFSLKPIALELKKLFKKEKVIFLSECIGKSVQDKINSMIPGQIVLLENLRYHKGEKGNDLDFAKELAKLGDFYINDAFSVSHREHASVVQLPVLLSSAAGLSLQKEVDVLSKVTINPKRPFTLIIGGKKSAKIEAIPKLINISDHLLLNGYLAKSILITKKILVRESDMEKEIIRAVNQINLTDQRIHLPKDVLFSLENDWSYKRIAALGTMRKEESVYDIGIDAIEEFSEIINKSKTIVWAGPMGFFEEDIFNQGTREVGNSIVSNKKSFNIVGGGDTISAIKKFNWSSGFDHISTGGSAMLQFLCGEDLPGIEILD